MRLGMKIITVQHMEKLDVLNVKQRICITDVHNILCHNNRILQLMKLSIQGMGDSAVSCYLYLIIPSEVSPCSGLLHYPSYRPSDIYKGLLNPSGIET